MVKQNILFIYFRQETSGLRWEQNKIRSCFQMGEPTYSIMKKQGKKMNFSHPHEIQIYRIKSSIKFSGADIFALSHINSVVVWEATGVHTGWYRASGM